MDANFPHGCRVGPQCWPRCIEVAAPPSRLRIDLWDSTPTGTSVYDQTTFVLVGVLAGVISRCDKRFTLLDAADARGEVGDAHS